MGDFNTDILKDNIDRPVHDYIDFYPDNLRYKSTRITEKTAI